jgi:hypothetical protein
VGSQVCVLLHRHWRQAECRAEWWARVGTCCLDNRWAGASRNGTVTVLARREAGAVQIGRALYEPQAEQVVLILKDGTSLTVKAGAGAEQWEL